MPRKDWGKTWFAVTLQRVGFRETRKVMEFAVAWSIVTRDLGRPPKNIEEYSGWWGQSAASGYREQTAWRAAWPEYPTPSAWFEAVGVDPAEAPEGGVEALFLSGQVA